MNAKNGMILDVNENPKKFSSWALLSIQHVLAMFVACITVPLIVFNGYTTATGASLANELIAPTIVSAGVGTLFYLIMTKFKSPIFLASSFAYMAPMMSAIALGAFTGTNDAGVAVSIPNLWILPVGMGFVGLVYVLVALAIKFFGVGWLNKLLPPIVIGPVIMVIGLSLAPSAVGNIVTASGAGSGAGYNLVAVFCGLVGMAVTALCAHYGTKTLSLIPFVVGMVAGYAVAGLITGIGFYGLKNDMCHIINFEPLVNNFSPIRFTSFLDYPKFLFLQQSVPLSWADVGKAAVLFIPVSFVTICEHIGDHKNLSNILQRDLLVDPGLTRTLIGDGVATSISGVLCGAANTSYGENIAVVGVTKIASTRVVAAAAGLAIFLGFFSPLMALTETIPTCVTGGVSLLLYGFIAASGVKMLVGEQIDFGKTKNIFVASVILVSGIGGLVIKFLDKSGNSIVSVTSIAVSMILGILMNVMLKEKKPENVPSEKSQSQDGPVTK